jgi:hypothetical protein
MYKEEFFIGYSGYKNRYLLKRNTREQVMQITKPTTGGAESTFNKVIE